MSDKQDKFQLLKSKYLEQVRSTERVLSELKAKLQLIQELETESENLGDEPATNGKYQTLGLTEAALDAVQTLGVGGGIAAGEVVKHLLAQGFKPKGKNFRISLGTTLRRLADQKKLLSELKDNNRLYKPL